MIAGLEAATLALETHAAHFGAASAILGSGQYVAGAVAASLVGVAAPSVPPAAAMSAVIAVLAAAAAGLTAIGSPNLRDIWH